MFEMEGPVTGKVQYAGWATSGVTDDGRIVLAIAAAKDGERITFVMDPRLAAALHATLAQAIALAGGTEEEKH